MIIGVGIDVCSVERFSAMLKRRPGVLERLLNPDERLAHGLPRSPESLAARFAAKEALAKALGAPGNLSWLDAEVVVGEDRRPVLEVRGTVKARADELGATVFHLSLSHDGPVATALVIAEAR
ncbi:holo-ACP synthase [Propionibacterium australiense]|uniref:Holo-[acyl-carrier-protein] synthase n=1 Tax=Propionibacterium australiense TaxID=119981 RepID=A0A383S7V0_9ACTN|nr:holo-ACP synthase [Propionibacterium australiense]RLP07926.1 holo-ACP synthase [Propionibacterium australiense]RLP08744.1 holo-ACP synthase [Propionibacterium australiense]SYZ33326.1 holo-[acyl-carrier-protein] synthase [Propionibacterium australiense]VEH89771.1 Holo-[acyl-carrier-protein] synthase [Propionibacterium australiense]